MPGPDLMLAFAVASLVFGYMPGPGMLYATARTLAGGRRAGLMAALGLYLGGFAHVLAAAFGLAAVFQALPMAYLLLKTLGAAYLIWLGVAMLRQLPQETPQNTPQPAAASFWQSVLVEVLNPKTALFYLAFLPQFTDPAAALPVWAQLLVLGTLVNLVFSSADLLCVLLAVKVQRTLTNNPASTRWMRHLGGCLLITLGLYTGLTGS